MKRTPEVLNATSRQISIGLLVLRVGIGCMMLVHGVQKMNGFSEKADVFPDPIGVGSQLSLILAIGAEVGCSVLLMLGLGTRLAVIPLAFTMIVAVFLVHGSDPWKVRELGAIYLLVYSSLLLTGPGQFSLDHTWFSKPSAPSSGSAIQTSATGT